MSRSEAKWKRWSEYPREKLFINANQNGVRTRVNMWDYFCIPSIEEVATQLGVSRQTINNKIRPVGIPRWPYHEVSIGTFTCEFIYWYLSLAVTPSC